MLENEENEIEEQLDGEEPTGTDDHDQETPAEEEPAAAGGEEAPQKPSRAARRAERGKNLIAEMRAENRRLNEQLAQLASRMGESVDANREVVQRMGNVLRPPPEDIGAKLRRELKEAAKRVREGDETAAEEFLAKQVEVAREMARHETREALQQFRESMPAAPTPQAAALLAAAPWLHEPDRLADVKAEVRKLARRHNRDLSDPRVKDATIKEAVARYAAEEGLECSFRVPAKTNGAAGVSGTGSRSFAAAAGSSTIQLDEFSKRMADSTPGYKHLPADKRYKKYLDEVIMPELKGA